MGQHRGPLGPATRAGNKENTYQDTILSFDGVRRGKDFPTRLFSQDPFHKSVRARPWRQLDEERGVALTVRELDNALDRTRRGQNGHPLQVPTQGPLVELVVGAAHHVAMTIVRHVSHVAGVVRHLGKTLPQAQSQ